MDDARVRLKVINTFSSIDGWRGRGYLPHYDRGGVAQFITMRLADSLPQCIHSVLSDELEALRGIGVATHEISLERQRQIERYLDAGYGACALQRDDVSGVVVDSLAFLSTQGHQILRWVIMPNHVHLLIAIRMGVSLSSVMHSFKGWTGRRANQVLGKSGRFWFPEYFDRYIRDDVHCSKVINYIDRNPVKAGLVKRANEWRLSSVGWKGELRGK